MSAKKIGGCIIKQLIIMLVGMAVGILLLTLVISLPTYKAKENIYYSMGMIEKEFDDEVQVDGYRATLTGNFTDCLMLEHAIYDHPGHSAFQQALRMYRAESYQGDDPEGWYPGQSLKDYLLGVEQPKEVEYSRYWHGYLIVLKPLLMLCGVSTLRIFNAGLQLLLMGTVIALLAGKNKKGATAAFIVSMPFMFFFSTYASFSLSICLVLTLVLMIVSLLFNDKLKEKQGYLYFFLIAGMLTAYFDFLTYPVVVIGYLLTLYLVLNGEKNIGNILLLSAEWCAGYGIFWASKWLQVLIFSSTKNTKALENVATRIGSAEGQNRMSGFLKVLKLNSAPYINRGFLIVLAIAVVGCLVIGIILGRKTAGDGKKRPGPMLLIPAIMPFVWFFLLQNHSEQHWVFTCRNFSVTVFAVGCLVLPILLDKQRK